MREISKNAEHNLLSSVLLRQTSQQKLKTQTGKSLLFLISCPVCVYLRRYYVTICAVAQMCFALTYALNENGFCVFFCSFSICDAFSSRCITAHYDATEVYLKIKNTAQLRNNMMFDNTQFYMNMIHLIRSHPNVYR